LARGVLLVEAGVLTLKPRSSKIFLAEIGDGVGLGLIKESRRNMVMQRRGRKEVCW
jgi:hypothetical protein